MISARHFGIIAHSAEGAALCLKTFCIEAESILGEHMHPDVTLDCIAMGEATPYWEAGDFAPIRAIFMKSAERLQTAGAEFFALPDNTAHLALEAEGPPFPLPGLHIAEVVASEAARRGMRRVAILGTKYTMEGPIYPREFAARVIDAIIPDAAERADINQIIFDELVKGVFRDAARKRYVQVIERLKAAGADAAALVCTEIPLLVTPDASPVPVLDSTRLLARAAIEVSTGKREFPRWRGGRKG